MRWGAGGGVARQEKPRPSDDEASADAGSLERFDSFPYRHRVGQVMARDIATAAPASTIACSARRSDRQNRPRHGENNRPLSCDIAPDAFDAATRARLRSSFRHVRTLKRFVET
ncbi:MAG TPA: hypothetical protein VES39_07630, partial [Rhodospirillales bacterium]|nr:hypothetical protein [Rhodospirillales bacterium]